MKNGRRKVFKRIDAALLVLLPTMAVATSLILKTNFLTTTLLFYLPTSIWLSFKTPAYVKKAFIFSLIMAGPFGFIIDYLGTIDHSWFIPATVFPFRLFGVVPIDDLVWAFFFAYNIIIFYEHFLDHGKKELVDKRIKYLLLPVLVVLAIFLLLLFVKPNILYIKFAYFWIALLLFILPAIAFLFSHSSLLSKFTKTASYFFLQSILFELTALSLGLWTFPGVNFIGWVELLGLRFPFEEFFGWMIFSSISVLSFYEFFDDDRK